MRKITIALVLLMVVVLAGVVFAQSQGYINLSSTTLTIKSGGSLDVNGTFNIDDIEVTASASELNVLDAIVTGQYEDDPNATSDSVYNEGIDADTKLTCTVNDTINGAYLLNAEPFDGGFVYTLSADPDDSVRISFIGINQ